MSTRDLLMLPRVCFVVETFYPVVHGATTQIRLLGQRFAQRGGTVTVITRRIRRQQMKTEMVDGYVVRRVSPVCGTSRLGKYLMVLPALWALTRQRKDFDVIIVYDFRVLGLVGVVGARLLHKTCVLRGATCGEMDGSYAYMFDKSTRPLKRAVIAYLARARNIILRRADYFLSICSPIKTELLNCGVSPRKIFELANGVDTELYSPISPTEKSALKKRLGLPPKFLFVFSGRLGRGKGLHTLMNVWKELARTYKHVHLIVVGSGQGLSQACDTELMEYVRINGLQDSVTFTGHVENVYEYLQASDCFVFPTENEAGSNSLIEAVACGLPCVATKVGGIIDVVTDDVQGLLVDSGDERQLLAAMITMLSDRKRVARFARESRNTALARFNIKTQVDKLERWLAAICITVGAN